MPDDAPETTPPVAPVATDDSAATANVRSRSFLQVWGTRGFITMVILFALSQPFIWFVWEPSLGDSLKNLITYSQIQVTVIAALAWWFLCSPVSRKTAWIWGVPALLLVAGFCLSIRKIEFTGDMEPHLVFHWQQTPDEILESHRRTASLEPTSVDLVKIPEISLEDMPEYRGIGRTGMLSGPLLVDHFDSPPAELWRHPIGAGYAGFAVVEPFLLTLEQRNDDEAIVCYDTATGLERWEFHYPAIFREAMGGPGPRSTPTVHNGYVYSQGALGDLFCLELLSGKKIWHVNILQQFGLPNNQWAMSSSPLVLAEQLIVNVGGIQGNGIAAYSLEAGELQWHTSGIQLQLPPKTFITGVAGREQTEIFPAPGYSSPSLETIDEVTQIVNLDGMGINGYDPVSGDRLWHYEFTNGARVNVAQPLVFDDGRIFVCASYGIGAAMVRVTRTDGQWSVEELWSNQNMRCKFSSPIAYQGYLYGLDEGILVCLDAETGKRQWKGGRTPLRGRYGHGQLLFADEKLIVMAESGDVVLVQPSPDELIELGHFAAVKGEKTWNPHALSRGILYVRNAREMAAYDLRAAP